MLALAMRRQCGCLAIRKHWEDLSAKRRSFKAADHVGQLDDVALRRAMGTAEAFGLAREAPQVNSKKKLGWLSSYVSAYVSVVAGK